MFGSTLQPARLDLAQLAALLDPAAIRVGIQGSGTPCQSSQSTYAYLNPPDNGFCYYDNPSPSNGNYRVPAGGSNQIVYRHPSKGNTVWNGNFGFCQQGSIESLSLV